MSFLNSRVVSKNEATDFAKKFNMIYMETSAKESINVNEAFMAVAEGILDGILTKKIDPKNEVGIKVGGVLKRELKIDQTQFEDDESEKKKQCC